MTDLAQALAAEFDATELEAIRVLARETAYLRRSDDQWYLWARFADHVDLAIEARS